MKTSERRSVHLYWAECDHIGNRLVGITNTYVNERFIRQDINFIIQLYDDEKDLCGGRFVNFRKTRQDNEVVVNTRDDREISTYVDWIGSNCGPWSLIVEHAEARPETMSRNTYLIFGFAKPSDAVMFKMKFL